MLFKYAAYYTDWATKAYKHSTVRHAHENGRVRNGGKTSANIAKCVEQDDSR